MTDTHPAPTPADATAAHDDERRRPARRKRRTPLQKAIVAAVAAAAALGGAVSGCEPTGFRPADIAFTGAAMAILTYAGARARRWSWSIVTAAAVMLSGTDTLPFAVLAVLLTFGAIALDRRDAVLGAVVAACAGMALLHTRDFGPHGVTALLSIASTVPLLRSAYNHEHRKTRLWIRRVVGGTVGAAAVALLAAGAAVFMARSQVEQGAAHTRQGLEAAEQGDQQTAIIRLGRANDEFGRAHDLLSTLGAPARLIPVVGQQLGALSDITDQGERITSSGGLAANEVDYDRIKARSGQFDLDEIRSVQQPLRNTVKVLNEAHVVSRDARNPWLLPPLVTRLDEFTTEVEDVRAKATIASEGADVAPGLLGGDGERHYLVLFTTPAEARGMGGFVSNWAEMNAVNGKIDMTRSGRITELRDAGPSPKLLVAPEEYKDRYSRFKPEEFLGDITFSPDFPTVAEVWRGMYPQAGGPELDGVIAVDPYGLQALLELTGPVKVPGNPEPLTSKNTADLLLREQYIRFADDKEERIDLLDEAGKATFEKLTEADLPGPKKASKVLAPLTRAGRLVVTSFHPKESTFFGHAGVEGRFPKAGKGDLLGVVGQNSGNNKIDVFLQRDIRYDVRFDPDTGAVSSTAVVTLNNLAPSSGLPNYVIGNRQGDPFGTNRMILSIYSPLALKEVTFDGRPTNFVSETEFGTNVYSGFVSVPPGSTAELRIDLEGTIEAGDYQLAVPNQPTVNTDRFEMTIKFVGSEGGRTATEPLRKLDRDLDLRVPFRGK